MKGLKTYKGTIDSVGPTEKWSDVGQLKFEVTTNLVIKTEDNQLKVIKYSRAPGIVDNYISPGTSGTFHLIELPSGLSLVIAIECSDGMKISDMDGITSEYNTYKKAKSDGTGLLFIGALTAPIIVGFFLLILGFSFRKTAKKFLAFTPDEVNSYVESQGISS
ncbi:MAG: hypothetical protein LPK15_14665 [Alteromonadaceae bacterium]|uniref:hypothetical protein n=1 Tax=Marinobacter sp. TaxID=50741 RepID=UPI0029C1192B|nr:hypothetical protein [Marinobacter sp.]MDX5385383.1 hypothetical protein [Marinobacter sp.]MDX5441676.1 hypothetical protein [Alteromonadaceae bacterium]